MAIKRRRRSKDLKAGSPGAGRRRKHAGRGGKRAWIVATAILLVLGSPVAMLWVWAARTLEHPRNHAVSIAPYRTRTDLAESLKAQGVIDNPRGFAAYWLVFHPFAQVEIGDHFISSDLSIQQMLARLTRSSSRPRARITIPEGWTLFQIAERLESKQVCSSSAFAGAARSPALMQELAIGESSAEGYLFPDTYDLYVDTASDKVVRRLVEEGTRRFNAVLEQENAAAATLREKYGFRLHEIITLGSIIEKEAHDPEEQATIAGVFFNRLNDEGFVPRHTLQSDPTAAYGCLAVTPEPPSCRDFHGRVTPEILRDANNPYNTYRHPGLPPGPIANPGIGAVRAVLRPAETPFYFFVANGHGGHVFSRTLKEHEAVVESAK